MGNLKTFAVVCVLAAAPGAVHAFGSPQAPEGSSHAGPPAIFSFGPSGGSYIGVFVAEVDADRAKALKLPEERGVEITRVEHDSPADKAGLKVGDVVLSYDGERIEGMEQFRRMIRETPAGRRATLTVFRNGATQTLTVVIGAMKAGTFTLRMPESIQITGPEVVSPVVPDMPRTFSGSRSIVLGVETEPLSPQLARFFGVTDGVLIRSVLSGTPAEKAGLRAGDVITKADDAEIAWPGTLSVAVRTALANNRPVSLRLVRNRQPITLTVPLEQQAHGTAPNAPPPK